MQSLEKQGSFELAHENYRAALAAAEELQAREGIDPSFAANGVDLESLQLPDRGLPDMLDLAALCRGGIARCLIRLGDITAGADLAVQIAHARLLKECAAILEEMHQAQAGSGLALLEFIVVFYSGKQFHIL